VTAFLTVSSIASSKITACIKNS